MTADRAPQRVQMGDGWRERHPGAVRVDAVTKWGNPFRVGEPNGLGFPGDVVQDAHQATELFARWWALRPELVAYKRSVHAWQHARIRTLRGRDLACWCPLPHPSQVVDDCHAVVLLEQANRPDLVDADVMSDPTERRAYAALTKWGCLSPQKKHYLTVQTASAGISRENALEEAQHAREHRTRTEQKCDLCHPDRPPRGVIACRCGGWIIGHPQPSEGTAE